MQGIVTVYIGRDEYTGDQDKQVIELIKKHNVETLKQCEEAGYLLMFLTSTNEASHAEKVDFDKPFPFHPPRGFENNQ